MRFNYISFLAFLSLLFNCSNRQNTSPFVDGKNTAFTTIPFSHSNVDFQNNVKETLQFNFINYSYIYNGGGVAIGDINNDGLDDIYFTSNQESNKLYLNQGNFIFDDITESANVQDDNGWSTGVTMVDINNDGWLDIYVCKSAALNNPNLRQNKLFINQKDATFKEEAAKYGLNQYGFSTQAYFLDFDKDGDLDMYLVNHRADFENNIVINPQLQRELTQEDSDHLFRNDDGQFVDITQQAGVANKAWGLSASIGDFNNDNWPDIYVANDFLEPDFLYINNQDGTFSDAIQTHFKHISTNSMGSDFADINNDMLPDLLVLDMMAADRIRGKENMATMSTENFNLMVESGYHHQYMSNMLQLNNGQAPYSEIGQLAGIAKTDWSWAPLIADFNNDGYKDIFITNGIENDLSNQDFRQQMRRNIMARKKVSLEEAIAMMPSTKLANYMFTNSVDFTFKDMSMPFGFEAEINSNGAAYSDLDNDGDLDLVLNNQSDLASIYRNNTTSNFLKVKLEGPKLNTGGLGAVVEVYTGEINQKQELYASRGYQSSIGYHLNFGLGQNNNIDSINVIWPDGKTQHIGNPEINSTLYIDYIDATQAQLRNDFTSTLEVVESVNFGINYKHQAVKFDDYEVQLLLPQKQSTIDNALAVADVNNDGLEDFFVGNTMGYTGSLYLQSVTGSFIKTSVSVFEKDKDYNDNNAIFFDADNDNDLDLYVASGNYSQLENDKLLQDRIYINDGNGSFKRGQLPKMLSVTKAVAANDFDGDGDVDLFVGGRVVPGKYPNAPTSYLLENRNGVFKNSISKYASELKQIGMINAALFSDYDSDGDADLIVTGEWMPVSVFNNDKGILSKVDLDTDEIIGWFQTIKAIDLDADGDEDYLVGNFGKNNKFQPSIEKPLHIYANHFDSNDSYDFALSKDSNGELFPVRGKECSSQQTPFLSEKLPTFKAFANASLVDIYGAENIENALHLKASSFESFYVENIGDGKLKFMALPLKAQFGPSLSFETLDIDGDENLEVIGMGSVYDAEVETIRYDASRGYVLNLSDEGDLKSNTKAIIHTTSDVKKSAQITISGQTYIMVLSANEGLEFIRLEHN
ncbi:MAG: VCBS repeat-containing protein [Flavobacteriaceae bacterium]|nr:VCBS repeat-containing protein [Flavobacteriaceae bacterium]